MQTNFNDKIYKKKKIYRKQLKKYEFSSKRHYHWDWGMLQMWKNQASKRNNKSIQKYG